MINRTDAGVDDVERLESFAITMFRSFLVGLEHNKAHRWTRESSDYAERNFIAAVQDYRLSLRARKEGP